MLIRHKVPDLIPSTDGVLAHLVIEYKADKVVVRGSGQVCGGYLGGPIQPSLSMQHVGSMI